MKKVPQQFNEIFNHPETSVFLCDTNFCILEINAVLESEKEGLIIGSSIIDEYHVNKIVLDKALKTLSDGLPFFCLNITLNRKPRDILMLPHIKDKQLESILCMISTDIIAEKAVSISTDRFRLPVSNILNMLSPLASRLETYDDYRGIEYLNEIARNCYSMLKTSILLNDYHNIVNGRLNICIKKFDLNSFLSDLCKTLQVMFVKTNYKLEYMSHDEPIIAEFDDTLLSLAVFSMVSNSCRFSPADSKISISLTNVNQVATIHIVDEGVGIPSNVISNVFEPFYSYYDKPTPEDEIGLGIGLSLTKKIMEVHEGGVVISSEVNKGTKVAIYFPIKNSDNDLVLSSDTLRYVTDRFSPMYLIFSDICKISFY